MITSLLPGLRDLRAPLVAGSLVLVACLLFFGGHVDSVSTQGGRSDRLDDLVAWIGRPGLMIAALLAAYLVGSLLVALARWPVHYSNRVAIYNAYFMTPYKPNGFEERPLTVSWTIPVESLSEARDEVQSHFRRWPRLLPFSRGSIATLLVEYSRFAPHGVEGSDGLPLVGVLEETLSDGGRRLRQASVDLHSDFDRPQAEAELRDAVVLALPLAVVALLLNTSLSVPVEVVLVVAVGALLALLYRPSESARPDRQQPPARRARRSHDLGADSGPVALAGRVTSHGRW